MVMVKTALPFLTDKQVDVPAWITRSFSHYQASSLNLIQQACDLAQTAFANHATFYGQACFEEALECAEMLSKLEADGVTIAAAIMYGSMQNSGVALADIEDGLNPDVYTLLLSIDKMKAISQLHQQTNRSSGVQVDNLRKMLLAMASDVRAVLVLLAKRLCVMRGIQVLGHEERRAYAEETMDVYAPLANRLGLSELKWELEDLCFHDTHPEVYQSLAKALNEKRKDREKRVAHAISIMEEKLSARRIRATITGRAKHLYSIYKKMQHKRLSFDEIYDTHAIRIIVHNLHDCYKALGLVHEQWVSMTEEFDDYIATPKPNGYRSIHTAVKDGDGKYLEIQIRTEQMHHDNESGVAAHWMYKEGRKNHQGYEEKIAWLRELLSWHKELAHQDEAADRFHDHVFEDRVYAFTPQGDIIDLPEQSTPLDFAYYVHSDVGHRCRGAKINGKIVPLSYALQTGDTVEILTTKIPQPSRDWLNPNLHYLTTSKARAKVHQWFKQRDTEAVVAPAAETTPPTPPKATLKLYTKSPSRIHPTRIHINGVSNLLTHMAKCCNPLPGEAIVGYITQGKGVSVHQELCKNILSLSPLGKARLLDAQWEEQSTLNYTVELHIDTDDTKATLAELTSVLAQQKVQVVHLIERQETERKQPYISCSVSINHIEQLNSIIHKIKLLSTVLQVRR